MTDLIIRIESTIHNIISRGFHTTLGSQHLIHGRGCAQHAYTCVTSISFSFHITIITHNNNVEFMWNRKE